MASDGGMQAVAVELDLGQTLGDEGVHVGEVDKLVGPVREQRRPVRRFELELSLLTRPRAVVSEQLGERGKRVGEDGCFRLCLDLELELCRVLDPAVHADRNAAWGSAFDDAERPQLRDPPREPRPLDDLDDAVDVLVGERRLLGEALRRRATDDDPPLLELAPELVAVDPLARRRAREGAPGTVAGGAERRLERARLAGEDEARRAHAARDEHRLAHRSVGRGDLGRAGWEGARRACALYAPR